MLSDPRSLSLSKGPVVRLQGVVKRFGTLVACDQIDLAVKPGTVHAVVGENGAGKSTLMKILAGELNPDEGSIEVDGIVRDFRSPREAQQAGIGIVHQHFLLADALRVWENVVLADEPGHPARLDIARARRRVADLAAENGFGVNVDALIRDLGVGGRQRVEILKVIYRQAKVIILDEPTAVLVPSEADALFAAMRRFTEAGAAVIFISHKLDEVLAFADEITVVRAGRVVGTTTPTESTAAQLAAMMVEVAMPTVEPRETPPGKEIVLAADQLTVTEPNAPARLNAVSFELRSAEILGVAGVEGNGQSELLLALLGRLRARDAEVSGRVLMDGADISTESTEQRRIRGLAYIPEDRHRDGLVLGLALRENAVLGYQGRTPVRRGPWFSRRAATQVATRIIERFDVRGGSPTTLAASLSGGNQQKFIVGRELISEPKVLVAAHPTRGVDIGAQAAVWAEMITARDAGLGIVLVSADLDELLALSDRLLVMYRGSVVAELNPRTTTAGELGEYMTGARGAGVPA